MDIDRIGVTGEPEYPILVHFRLLRVRRIELSTDASPFAKRLGPGNGVVATSLYNHRFCALLNSSSILFPLSKLKRISAERSPAKNKAVSGGFPNAPRPRSYEVESAELSSWNWTVNYDILHCDHETVTFHNVQILPWNVLLGSVFAFNVLQNLIMASSNPPKRMTSRYSSILTEISFRMTPGFLFFLAAYFLTFAAYDNHRGITLPPGRYAFRGEVSRIDDPKQFQDIMAYKWIRGSLAVFAWISLVSIRRRMEKIDPFSPKFAGNAELDELGRILDKEERQRHRLL